MFWERRRLFLILFATFVAVGSWGYWSFVYEKSFKLVILDVGQGNGAYIQTPDGFEMIVDSGAHNKTLRNLGGLRYPWDRRIDLMIASHADTDHVGMFPDLLRRYHVDTFISTPFADAESPPYKAVLDEVKKQNVTLYFPEMGKRYAFARDVSLTFLHPAYDSEKLSDNDSSLVFILQYKDIRFLFTGDISAKIEKELAHQYGNQLKSDVLIVGHHGSKTSSSPEFIKTVSPTYSVISSGEENRYGHPHKQTLETLSRYGSFILRTDEMGNIQFRIYKNGEFDIIGG